MCGQGQDQDQDQDQDQLIRDAINNLVWCGGPLCMPAYCWKY